MPHSHQRSSRISGFYKRSLHERLLDEATLMRHTHAPHH